jgi:hypothetical protein
LRELEFGKALSGRLNEASIGSYLAYCRRVERELGIDLDTCDLTKTGCSRLSEQLLRAGFPRKSVANSISALRAYSELVAGGDRDGGPSTHDEDAASPASFAPIKREGAPLEAICPAPSKFQAHSVAELLGAYADVMGELRKRGIVRTGNSPVGDYAELLFANAFGWSLQRNSASAYDALDGQGVRYQIKGRRLSHPGASRQLGALRKLFDNTFDVLAAALFNDDFTVMKAVLVPHEVVLKRARRSEHTNSWIFLLDDHVWNDDGVRDVTMELKAEASKS